MPKHTAVWLDHAEARIFHLHPDPSNLRRREAADETTVTAPSQHFHRHQRGHDGEGHEHPERFQQYLEEVRKGLAGADAILILGPSTAKQELMTYLETHDQQTARRVIGVETVDHPTDSQIVALANEAFRKSDRMS